MILVTNFRILFRLLRFNPKVGRLFVIFLLARTRDRSLLHHQWR